MALPIAYLIVMWVFVRDPLGIGEGLSNNVPFLVPTALHAKSDSNKDEAPVETNAGFFDTDENDQFQDSTVSDLDIFNGKIGTGDSNIGAEALRGLDN